MNETIDYEEEKRNSERITRKDEELIEICDFEVGHKDGNCGAYKKAKKVDADATKLQMGVLCAIFIKLIAKMKKLMRRHDAKLFEEDDD